MNKPIELDIDAASVKNKTVVMVDDVAQSGKTLLYAMKPLLEHTPSKIQIAVLVDRKHKRFPVTADFVGLLLSTGAHEQVILEMDKGTYAYLVD
jgi:pyrimidine operon attenuation protein/uracil phosphoribosyltransferase